MRYRKLGDTGLSVSEIGFGTIPILSGDVPVLPDYYSPDIETAVSIMRNAFDMGCNLYDTAIPEESGDAEYKVGRFAALVPREEIIISDKARKYTGKEMRDAVLLSCDNLKTNPDIYFVHQADEKNAHIVFSPDGALEALWRLKQEGVIRFVGIASHYYSVLERAAKDDRVDVLQASGNILECGVLNRLKENGLMQRKGFLLNKVYAAGLLTQAFPPAELIGGILHYPISSALIGIGTFEQADAAMGKEYSPWDIPFEEALDVLGRRCELIACDRCQRCVCRYRHEIHSVLRYLNYSRLGKEAWAMEKLSMYIFRLRRHCMICGERSCESSCPRSLPIPALIEMICLETEKWRTGRKKQNTEIG